MKKALRIILKILVITFDVALVPGLVLCRYLSEQMLETDSSCLLLQFNGKCLSCGGTHFVYDLLSGRIIDAFMDNQFFFLCALYLLITLIAVNLYVLFKVQFAKKVLRFMYNLPALLIFIAVIFFFLLLRNIPMVLYFAELIFDSGVDYARNVLEGK